MKFGVKFLVTPYIPTSNPVGFRRTKVICKGEIFDSWDFSKKSTKFPWEKIFTLEFWSSIWVSPLSLFSFSPLSSLPLPFLFSFLSLPFSLLFLVLSFPFFLPSFPFLCSFLPLPLSFFSFPHSLCLFFSL